MPVLALDIGTSSVRTAIFDDRGERLPGTLAQIACNLLTDTSGRAEMEPQDFLRRVQRCLKKTLKSGPPVSAVGVSCFWHSLIGTDADGKALTPILTWADSRCRADAARLREEIDERLAHAGTGCMVRSSFWPAKLRWLRRTDAPLFRKVRRWMSPAEWLQLHLTGKVTCAHGMATGTGLYDPNTLTWNPALLELSGVEFTQLNAISDQPTGWSGIPWFPAIGDGAASNLGSGATKPGLAAINVGTSAAIRLMQSGPVARAPLGLFCYRVDAERYLVGGAVSNAGNLHAWSVKNLRLHAPAALEAALAARPRPEHGLTVLPFWGVERAPDWNEDDHGVIHGITHATSAIDLLQAITEGFYFRLAKIAALLPGEPPPKWIVSGGILKSPSALNRLSNVLGAPVYPNPEAEASLRGAAVFALEKLDRTVSSPRLPAAVRPDRAIHRLYLAERAKADALSQRFS